MPNENTVTADQINKLLDASETQEHIYWDKELVISYKLPNGFTISGSGACVDPANFDIEVGRKYAKEDAANQLWKFEGYLLQQVLYEGAPSGIIAVAKIAHEINRAYCQAIGDNSQLDWDESPEWQRESAVLGVMFHRDNPDADASASHNSWLKQKTDAGWVYGEVKDPEKKKHPCITDFSNLPKEQQAKDFLFRQVVHSLI